MLTNTVQGLTNYNIIILIGLGAQIVAKQFGSTNHHEFGTYTLCNVATIIAKSISSSTFPNKTFLFPCNGVAHEKTVIVLSTDM